MKKLLFISVIFCLTLFYCARVFSFNLDLPIDSTATNIVENVYPENAISLNQPVVTQMNESNKNELLSVTNIINILVIVVGIVLILLGIAILIRCK